ncbi:helix-turn-helix domain-containing protein [Marinibacterium sp. SX1]|uniref:helix-turn-helix domain-containing protein n=1 Tax=Marinibacterium sp. SX1 TaxID=3388424 RepID=UPI003D18486F
MIGRRDPRRNTEHPNGDLADRIKSFDDFELKLGDVMRGERATMGKSLLDVQRELRIKATYIAAIENSDPSAFDTPGFIAGYVRSYARYLNMDPEECFAAFCAESGFSVAHGMSAEASSVRKPAVPLRVSRKSADVNDPFLSPKLPFAPSGTSFWADFEPRAIGSTLVLLMLIGGIGYGGWMVLKQVQQVQLSPVEQTPVVLSDLDPLEAATARGEAEDPAIAPPSTEALDRLYRPAALDLPVLVARDAPISTLDPDQVGTLRPSALPDVDLAEAAPAVLPGEEQGPLTPQVVEDAAPALVMVTVRPSWVRVRSADGSVIFEGIMEPGATWEVPATEEPPTLRAGESGAVYFSMNGQHYGPVGPAGTVTSNVPLSIGEVSERFAVANLEADRDLARVVAEAQGILPAQ